MAWDNEKKKVKTAVAVAYEPGDKAPKILEKARSQSVSLKRQKKMMYRFIRIIS